MSSFAVIHDVCKFCLSNGESEAQYRSHLLKNKSGLITCPVLRVHVCPICGAMGDFAHTQRYCPLNKDGHFNSGASLVELKKKKNAAGNYPSSKKMYPSPHFYHNIVPNKNYTPCMPKMTTAPLPSVYRPPTKPSSQLFDYLKYHNYRQLQHQAEVERVLQKIRFSNYAKESSPTGCYARNFPSPKSSSPPQDRFIYPEMDNMQYSRMVENNVGTGLKNIHAMKHKLVMNEDKKGQMVDDNLGNLLAELREGTEEIAMV